MMELRANTGICQRMTDLQKEALALPLAQRARDVQIQVAQLPLHPPPLCAGAHAQVPQQRLRTRTPLHQQVIQA